MSPKSNDWSSFHIISASSLVTLIESNRGIPKFWANPYRWFYLAKSRSWAGLARHWIQWKTQSAQSNQDLGAHWAHRRRTRRRKKKKKNIIWYYIPIEPAMYGIHWLHLRLKERSMLSWAIGFAVAIPLGLWKSLKIRHDFGHGKCSIYWWWPGWSPVTIIVTLW